MIEGILIGLQTAGFKNILMVMMGCFLEPLLECFPDLVL